MTVDPDAARRDAQHILSDRRFHSSPAPRPLRGPLQWIGDRLRGIFDWLGLVLSHVPGWLLLLLGVMIVGAVIARIVVAMQHRKLAPPPHGARAPDVSEDDGEDPNELERAAERAERAGDLERAVRLRFRAGLLRLGDRGFITYRPSVTTGEVRRALGSDTFDELARTFEAIAYGGRAAAEPDVDAARARWPRVLDEAGRR